MAVSQDTVVLFGPYKERTRTTSRGTKQRLSVTVKATPILHNFDDRRLGEKPAEAIKSIYFRALAKAEGTISEATVAHRQRALVAHAAGKKWAKERYAKGRAKREFPPIAANLSRPAMFSGRLAHGLFVRENAKEKEWTINVPANRFSRSTSRDEAQYRRMLSAIQKHFPSVNEIRRDKEFKSAAAASIRQLIVTAETRNAQLKRELAAAYTALGGRWSPALAAASRVIA
jgi:hypothetical protein